MDKKTLIVFVVAFALVVFVATTWKSCSQSEAAKQIEAQTQVSDARDLTQAKQEENSSSTAETSLVLTDRQKQLIAAYGDSENSVRELLQANLWTTQASSSQAHFADNSITESQTGQSDKIKPFVIASLKHEKISEGGAGYIQKYTGSVDIGDKDSIFTLSQTCSASGVEQPWVLECDAFDYATRYVLSQAATDLQIIGINDGVTLLLGNSDNVARMCQQLTEYCSRKYPTASVATWDKSALIDYVQNTLMLTFELNNQSKTKIQVMCELGGATFEIGVNH